MVEAAPSQQKLAARRPRPSRRLAVRCLACGILRSNGASIEVLAVRLSHCDRVDGAVRGVTMLTGLCLRCVREAVSDQRLPASPSLQALLAAEPLSAP